MRREGEREMRERGKRRGERDEGEREEKGRGKGEGIGGKLH